MVFYPDDTIALTSSSAYLGESLGHHEWLTSTKENAPPCEVALGEVVGKDKNSACTESG